MFSRHHSYQYRSPKHKFNMKQQQLARVIVVLEGMVSRPLGGD